MTTAIEVFADGFSRVTDDLAHVLDGIDPAHLDWRPDGATNSITWLAWHITRVQDAQISELAQTEQVWTSSGWSKKFTLPVPDDMLGYGQSSQEAAQVRGVPVDLLMAYLGDVHEATLRYLRTLDEAALERIIDRSWDPPVTVAVRVVSIIADNLQHVGQAGFLRGIAERSV